MQATLSANEIVTAETGSAVDLTGVTPDRKECLSEFSTSALIIGSLGVSVVLWMAIFFVI